MNRPLSILALSGALALGAFAGTQFDRLVPAPAPAATATASPSASSQGTLLPTRAPAPAQPYDSTRARTESEQNTVQVVNERRDGLVYISVTDKGDSASSELRKRLQEQFPFALPDDLGEAPRQGGTGSGFFVTSQGDIITNNHVVEGASDIKIRLHGSRTTYSARVVARAPDFDLALLRAENLPDGAAKPLPLGDSDALDVGLKAIAMGAPFGLDFSVSEGIISSLERRVPVGTKNALQSVIQTDAAINPGNSGGPLLDSAGQVIGVNTQILTGGISQSAGVGFAIPINTVKSLLPQLRAGKNGEATVIQTPSLGISFGDAAEVSAADRERYKLPEAGAVVSRVYPGSPAQKAGLRGGTVQGREVALDGDVITAVDGEPLTDSAQLPTLILSKQIGETVTLTVQRAGKSREVKVRLAAFDLNKAAQSDVP